MGDALSLFGPINRRFTFALLAVLAQFVLAPNAHALSTQCTLAFNRVTSLMNQGPASLCNNQQQMLTALDAAAAACAGEDVDFGAIKAAFMSDARQCPAAGAGQANGSSRPTPNGGNASLNNARADGDRADQYLKDMEKCAQISDPDGRSACSYSITRVYRAGGSGQGASANTSGSGKGGSSASSGPDENPDQPPKALPPPKDPGIDYSGQSCAYFTRPAVEVEVRLNYYAKGSCVSYGNSAYECGDDGRWLRKGPAAVFKCITAEEAETSGHSVRHWDITKD